MHWPDYVIYSMIVYAHGRRLCSNRFRHGSTTISYPQCSLTFPRECYLRRCREQSCAIRAYAMSAVGIDVERSTTISYPQCSLTFVRERYLHICREQSFAIRAYAMSAVGINVVSSHTKYCRIEYGITRWQNALQDTNEQMASDFMTF